MLPGDGRSMVDRRLLSDSRVTNMWDEQQAVGRWFAANVPASRGTEPRPISWDVYLLYGPAATWGAAPASMGHPVIGARAAMSRALGRLGAL